MVQHQVQFLSLLMFLLLFDILELLKLDLMFVSLMTSMELASEVWGLIGKVDCLRKRDGAVIP